MCYQEPHDDSRAELAERCDYLAKELEKYREDAESWRALVLIFGNNNYAILSGGRSLSKPVFKIRRTLYSLMDTVVEPTLSDVVKVASK